MPDSKSSLQLKTDGLIQDTNEYDHVKDPDEEGAKQLKKLKQREKRFFYFDRLIALNTIVILCLAIIVVFVLHLILPANYRWLTAEEIDTIKNISLSAVGGLIGTVATNHFMKK